MNDDEMKTEKTQKILMFSIIIVLIFIIVLNVKTLIGEIPYQRTIMAPKLSQMSLTDFDVRKAKELMDKDGDNKCDFCGMPVETCIDSGEMECTMNPNSKIGKLGSQHIHADWKIFINGSEFDFSNVADRHEKQMQGDKTIKDTSAFIHIHPAQSPENAGEVLHMHAAGVPLSIFFESLGMNLINECLIISSNEKYCNTMNNKLKMFVNGKPNEQYGDYIFNDLDKILISYGLKDEDVSKQLVSITNFGGVH